MNQEQLNSLRRMAGLAPSYNAEERHRLDEKRQIIINEAANHRAPNTIKEIAREHLNVRSLEKTGDDNKDYHDLPCWAIEKALKAAYKAGLSGSKPVKESVEDKESKKESKKGGNDKPGYDAKGGEKTPKDGKDKVEKGKDVTEGKKADKDYDKDGKVESEKAEYQGSKIRAAKKAGNLKEAGLGAPMGEPNEEQFRAQALQADEYENAVSSYKKGASVTHKGKVCIVHVPDAQADYVGIIPLNLRNAPEGEKDKAVDLVKKGQLNPASEEECEMAYSNEEMGYAMGEGSSEGYNNPKGTKLTSDAKSGANAKKGDANKAPHKDNSHGAKSEDKGTKGLKKIGEAEDATVWGKDYGHDDKRIDKTYSPDQLKAADHTTDDKINVPASHKTALKEEISKLRKEAERCHIRDPHASDFYHNTADAFENLLEHLKEGTKRSLNLAQIDMNRVMGPIIQRIPNEVYMFIVRGGKPASLTELFKEVKIKKETGADLSKEDYTK